ncbi:hypothetical protein HDU80_002075 [Chytriomyces hyalinus]|nr:hypothetical protein HDU80_002075 [Chytriomyces hyalinus]
MIIDNANANSLDSQLEDGATFLLALIHQSQLYSSTTPFVEIADAALNFAKVDAWDVVGDLGCGDGRVLVQALTGLLRPPQRAVGIELDPRLVEHLRQNVVTRFEKGKLAIIESDMFKVDLEELGASVLVLYLLPDGLEKLKPQLTAWFKNGAESSLRRRIVTIAFSIPGWNCDRAVQVSRQWLFYYDVREIRE